MTKEKNIENVDTNTEKVNANEMVEELKRKKEEIKQESTLTAEKLNKESKVRIKIPTDPQNPNDEVVSVMVNGYSYFINRNETVEVPESVANLLENAKYI